MGESHGWLFEPSFNRAVKVQASDERITSDAGLLLLREADHRLGLTEWLARQLDDPRRQDLIRYQLVELLRERVYALALGYSAQDDADRLAHDPAMKLAAWDRPGEHPLEERLASQPTQSRLIDILTYTPGNRAALRDALCESCERHLRATGGDTAARKVTIDVDSFPILVHGQQPGAAYNGHYQETVYHPLCWPVTRWPATTTACRRDIAWETASFMRSCGKARCTRRTASSGSCRKWRRKPNAWAGSSTSASTPATPTARRWTS